MVADEVHGSQGSHSLVIAREQTMSDSGFGEVNIRPHAPSLNFCDLLIAEAPMSTTAIIDADLNALGLILRHRCSATDAAYRTALGLEADELADVVTRFFPHVGGWCPGECFGRQMDGHCCDQKDAPAPTYGSFSLQLMRQEEADLCQLLLGHRSTEGIMSVLFARLIARACMEPEHLWMCLGLESRDQLSAIFQRHFRPLFAKNGRNMRWKKFFYKILCDLEKVWTCQASACEICAHYGECYAPEIAFASSAGVAFDLK